LELLIKANENVAHDYGGNDTAFDVVRYAIGEGQSEE
jgi:hypothetical protein